MKSRVIAYWVTTVLLAFELLAGSVTDLIHGKEVLVAGSPVVDVITHLGYPVYLLTIIGSWKLLGAAAILVPQFPRLKEWTYAGAFFEMTGAIASHLACRDNPTNLISPIVFTVLIVASWSLRPQSRVLGTSYPPRAIRAAHSEHKPEQSSS